MTAIGKFEVIGSDDDRFEVGKVYGVSLSADSTFNEFAVEGTENGNPLPPPEPPAPEPEVPVEPVTS